MNKLGGIIFIIDSKFTSQIEGIGVAPHEPCSKGMESPYYRSFT